MNLVESNVFLTKSDVNLVHASPVPAELVNYVTSQKTSHEFALIYCMRSATHKTVISKTNPAQGKLMPLPEIDRSADSLR